MKTALRLVNPEQAHAALMLMWRNLKPLIDAGKRFDVVVSEEKRSNDQNAAQWPILDAFSKQLRWPVNGQMVEMSDEEWKDVLTAAFRQENVRLAMGLNGGVVMLGGRTSKFSRQEFSEWLDFLKATAAQRGVELHHE